METKYIPIIGKLPVMQDGIFGNEVRRSNGNKITDIEDINHKCFYESEQAAIDALKLGIGRNIEEMHGRTAVKVIQVGFEDGLPQYRKQQVTFYKLIKQVQI